MERLGGGGRDADHTLLPATVGRKEGVRTALGETPPQTEEWLGEQLPGQQEAQQNQEPRRGPRSPGHL